jgi:hypothetical protein
MTEKQINRCHAIIHSHALAAGAGNAIPAPGLLHSPTSDGKSQTNLPESPFSRGDALKDSSPPLNSSTHQFSDGLHELKFQFSGKLQMII